MPKRTKKKREILSSKECLNKLIIAAATLDCTAKALRGMKLKTTAGLVQDAIEDVLRVAAVFQLQVLEQKTKEVEAK